MILINNMYLSFKRRRKTITIEEGYTEKEVGGTEPLSVSSLSSSPSSELLPTRQEMQKRRSAVQSPLNRQLNTDLISLQQKTHHLSAEPVNCKGRAA